jgi:hypothetical protein
MLNLCKYKNILGIPKKGAHSYRIGNIAMVDILSTFLLAYVVKKYTFPQIHYGIILACCFISGIILHRLFCVRTTIDRFLFDG